MLAYRVNVRPHGRHAVMHRIGLEVIGLLRELALLSHGGASRDPGLNPN